MAKKNANGDGSIYQRKDGLWCGAVTVGLNNNGTPKRKTLYDRDRDILRDKIIDLQNDIAINDGYIRDDQITLKQWVLQYLRDFIKPTIRATTYDSYVVLCRNHIDNTDIATMKLKDIKPYHLQSYFKTKTYLSKSSIKKIYLLLNIFFENAVKNDLIRKNPMYCVNRPNSEKEVRDIEIMSLEEQKSYMAVLDCTSYKVLLVTALFTGMRQGELLALTWENTDLIKKELKVVSTFKETRIYKDDGSFEWQMVKQPPKTKSGIRTIPLPDFLIKELTNHKRKQVERAIELDRDNFNPQHLVFCSEEGTPLNARNTQRAHKLVCEKAKINPVPKVKGRKEMTTYGVSFHALRHTFATRMIEAGVDVKTVQYWLGHSTIQMTYNIYVHVQEQTKKAAAQVQNDLFASLI